MAVEIASARKISHNKTSLFRVTWTSFQADFAMMPITAAATPQPAVAYVCHGQRNHHQERRCDKRKSRDVRAYNSRAHVSEINRQLCGQRTGRKLRQRQSIEVLLLCYPTTPFDQVPLHVRRQRDRPAKSDGAKAQEIGTHACQ